MIRRILPALAVLALVLACAHPAAARAQGAPVTADEAAGTWRIDDWRGLEARGLYHFFYLDPGGRFFLAGEWPGSESSRFGGTWYLDADRLHLAGVADVNTSQGHWTIPFQRTFTVQRAEGALRITPLPEKNRFGLMGWPNAFVHFAHEPAVNLPGGKLPTDPQALVALSAALAPGK